MQKKQLQQWLVGLTGGCLCLFVFGTTAFAQSAVPADKILVTSTVFTDTVVTDTVDTDTIITGTLNAEPGLLIVAVEPASPAAKAGLVRGDIVLKINAKPVNNLQDTQAMLSTVKAGDSVTVTVQHGDATRDLKVTLGERRGRPFLGIVPFVSGPSVTIARPSLRGAPEAFAVTQEATPALHVRVIEVVKDSPAEKSGLQAGDAIVAINGKLVTPEAGLARQIKALAPGDVITLEVQQDEQGSTRAHTVTLGKYPDNPTQAFLGVKVAPVEIRLFKKQMLDPAQGNTFEFAVPAPAYGGWWMPAPYAPGLPLMLVMPYGAAVGQLAPGSAGGAEENFFYMPYPGTPYPGTPYGTQNFLYRMPPQMPAIPAVPPLPEPVQIELSEDTTL